MWPDSPASCATGRVDPLAVRLEHLGDRVLSEPVDLEIGAEPAQFLGDGDVAAGVAEADRRGDVQRPPAPGQGPRPAARRRSGADEIAQQQVHLDRVAAGRNVAGAFECHELAAGGRRERRTLRERPDLVPVAMNHERRAPDSCAHRAEVLVAWNADPADRVRQRLGRRLECPAGAVFDLLGRVRLVQALREEELEEGEVVPLPVVAVVLRPPLVGVERLIEWVQVALGEVRGQPDRGGDVDDPVDTLGVLGGEDRPPQRGARQAHEGRPLGAAGIQDRERVRGKFIGAVRLGAGRPVRAAVAPAVEGHHTTVAGEIRNLHLPGTGVDDRPCRQQQRRRVALAIALPEDPHAVALHVPLGVGISGARLLAAIAVPRPDRRRGGSGDRNPSSRAHAGHVKPRRIC